MQLYIYICIIWQFVTLGFEFHVKHYLFDILGTAKMVVIECFPFNFLSFLNVDIFFSLFKMVFSINTNSQYQMLLDYLSFEVDFASLQITISTE